MYVRTLLTYFFLLKVAISVSSRCRSRPGDSGFPSQTEWDTLNDTVDGRLLTVIPSAEVCSEVQCTDTQWASSVFRSTIPGQMNEAGTFFFWQAMHTHQFRCEVQLGAGVYCVRLCECI
jgi:hypothetical protein